MVSTTRLRINRPKVIHEVFDDEVVIVNLDSGSYFSLDKAGADIWGLVDRGATDAEIAQEIEYRYNGDRASIEHAVKKFLSELQEESLIVVDTYADTEGTQRGHNVTEPNAVVLPFEAPIIHKYTDMEALLLLDPIHEVDELGWPITKQKETG